MSQIWFSNSTTLLYLAVTTGLGPVHRLPDYFRLSKPVPYQLGLHDHFGGPYGSRTHIKSVKVSCAAVAPKDYVGDLAGARTLNCPVRSRVVFQLAYEAVLELLTGLEPA